MQGVWTFRADRLIYGLKYLLLTKNPILLLFIGAVALAVCLFLVRMSIGSKKRYSEVIWLIRSAYLKSGNIFFAGGSLLSSLLLLKSAKAFFIGFGLLSLTGSIIHFESSMLLQLLVFIFVTIGYLWTLIFFVVTKKCVKNLKKPMEYEEKTQEKDPYSEDFSDEFNDNSNSTAIKTDDERSNLSENLESLQHGRLTEINRMDGSSFNGGQSLALNPQATNNMRQAPVRSKQKKLNDKQFYESRGWRELRFKILTDQGRECALCHTTDGVFHVDHIRPRSKYPHLELDPSNLQVLCADCNLGKSNFV